MPSRAELETWSLSRLQNIATERGLIGANVFSRIDPYSRRELIEALDENFNPPQLEEFTINHDLDEELLEAVKNQDYIMVRALLEEGANPLAFIEFDEEGDIISIKNTPLVESIISLENLSKETKKTAIKIFDTLMKFALTDFDLQSYSNIFDELLEYAV